MYGGFELAWRAAFEHADGMTPTRGHVRPEIYERLAALWNPAQIIEITAVIALFNYFNRFALALDVPVTR